MLYPELLALILAILVIAGPVGGLILADRIRDFILARRERRRRAAGGEVFDDVPTGLDIRGAMKGMEKLRPPTPEPQSYPWTERRPNEPREHWEQRVTL